MAARLMSTLKTDLDTFFHAARVLTPTHDAATLLASLPRKALLKAVAPLVRWRDGALTRHVVFGNSEFNLVLTSWAPGSTMTTLPGQKASSFRVLKGSLHETATPAGPASAHSIGQGGCCFQGQDEARRLEASEGATLTLHMFSPPLVSKDLAF